MNINDLNKLIPNYNFQNIEHFEKGWSEDKKFILKDGQNKKYLLRLSPQEKYEQTKMQIDLINKCMSLNLPVQQLIEHGELENEYYTLFEWINGNEASSVLPQLDEEIQFQLGLEAGRILKAIHSIPCHESWNWREYFLKKIERKIETYNACDDHYDNDTVLFEVIEQYQNRLTDKQLVYHHGDYHVGNMVIDDNGKLWIIDFDRCSVGEPFEEFNRISWCVNTSEAFSRGRVDGYFGHTVPLEFWELLIIYISTNILSSLPWAIPFGESQVQVMKDEYLVQYRQYDGFTKVIPNWYRIG